MGPPGFEPGSRRPKRRIIAKLEHGPIIYYKNLLYFKYIVNFLNREDFHKNMVEIPKSIKRFGSRYGRRTKLLFGQIEEKQRKLHQCPYCKKISVKRISSGIWQCKKCNIKFTGKAYTL